jgi:hypothetical protein
MASDMALGLDGKIYVAGHFGGITVLSADGARLKTIQISKDLNLDYLQQIAVDGSGDFYLLDGKNYAVFKLSPDGKLLTRFGGKASVGAGSASRATFSAGAQNLAIDSQGRLYVSEVTRIAVFDPNGNFLNDFATTQAFGMTFNDKDELFVAARPFVIKYNARAPLYTISYPEVFGSARFGSRTASAAPQICDKHCIKRLPVTFLYRGIRIAVSATKS